MFSLPHTPNLGQGAAFQSDQFWRVKNRYPWIWQTVEAARKALRCPGEDTAQMGPGRKSSQPQIRSLGPYCFPSIKDNACPPHTTAAAPRCGAAIIHVLALPAREQGEKGLMAGLYSFIPGVFKTDAARVLPYPGVQEPEWIISRANKWEFQYSDLNSVRKAGAENHNSTWPMWVTKLTFSITVQGLAEESIK